MDEAICRKTWPFAISVSRIRYERPYDKKRELGLSAVLPGSHLMQADSPLGVWKRSCSWDVFQYPFFLTVSGWRFILLVKSRRTGGLEIYSLLVIEVNHLHPASPIFQSLRFLLRHLSSLGPTHVPLPVENATVG